MTIHLTDEQIDEIAEKAAEKAVAKMTAVVYREIGRGVINKLFWMVGIITVAVYSYLQGKGVLK